MANDPGKAIEFQGVMTALHVLRVLTPEIQQIAAALDKKIGQLPTFFANAPVAIDLRDLEPEGAQPGTGAARLRLGPLVDLLRTRGLVPVAIRGGVPGRIEEARALHLGVLEWDRAAAARKAQPEAGGGETATINTAPASPPAGRNSQPTAAASHQPAATFAQEALVLSQPLRAGQIIYAENRDAVAVAAVNMGAELIADGNIHVYSVLRGRALAGARGNDQARIFCQRLEAELVSIAGVYASADEIPKDKHGKAVQIYLRDGSLVIAELSAR
jgi:septum site-determining protein MinC